jgi:O-methyltransferase
MILAQITPFRQFVRAYSTLIGIGDDLRRMSNIHDGLASIEQSINRISEVITPPSPGVVEVPAPKQEIEMNVVAGSDESDILRQEYEELKANTRKTVYDLARLANETIFAGLSINEQQIRCLINLAGTPVFQAFYIIDALRKTTGVPGDACEYGVATGRTSALMAASLLSINSKKRLWLYDSFEGLPKPHYKDLMLNDLYNLGDMSRYEGMFSFGENCVRAELIKVGFPQDQAEICKGWITTESLREKSPTQISMCYLDMDFYQSTKVVLEFLIERMPLGGIVVLDDYNFFSQGVKTAVDEIMADFPHNFTLQNPYSDKFAVLTRI